MSPKPLSPLGRILAGAGVATLAVAGLSACASMPSSSETAASPGSAEGAVIGISYSYIQNSYNTAASRLLSKYAEEAGFKPLPVTDANADSSKQIADIQTLISRGAKGLIVTPSDSKVLLGAVTQATAKGIPVVTPDIGISTDKVFVNVRPSSLAMGTSQCEAAGEALGGKGNLFYEAGDLSGQAGNERWTSFNSCMQDKFPGITVTMKQGKWDANTATSQIETAFGSGTKYDALILASDSVYANGAVATLKKLGLLVPVGQPGHIYMSGIDGSPEGIQAVKNGEMDATIVQPLVESSKLTVQYLKDAMEGKKLQVGKTDHNSEVKQDEDGSFTDYVSSFIATKDNANDENIWGNLKF